MSRIKTLTQERANFVLERVREIKESGNREKIEKFKTNSKKISSLIVSNGLIPTLAFLKSEDRKLVYDTINDWLKQKNFCQNDALEELLNSDASKLRLVTMEALELSNWLKRIVEIEMD